MTTDRDTEAEVDPAFPPVDTALIEGTASPAVVHGFLEAVQHWRRTTETWARIAADHGVISSNMRSLLLWTIGSRMTPQPQLSAAHLVTQLDAVASRSAVAVLVWRSGLVDYLADVWDTIGAAPFEPHECMVVIEETLTPHRVRGMYHCPDCVQVLSTDPAVSGQHSLVCPVRLNRLRA